MSHPRQLPEPTDFPEGTEFVIKEFDVPLARTPDGRWWNWYGGSPSAYSAQSLRVDNNWPANSFEAWLNIIRASMKPRS